MNNRRRNTAPERYVSYHTQRADVAITLATNGLKFWIRFYGLIGQDLTDEEWKHCINLAMKRRGFDPGDYFMGHYTFPARKEAAA